MLHSIPQADRHRRAGARDAARRIPAPDRRGLRDVAFPTRPARPARFLACRRPRRWQRRLIPISRLGETRFGIFAALGLENIAIDYIVVDTLRVPRETFATIIDAWRDGYAGPIGEFTPISRESAMGYFNAMVANIRDPMGYAVWMVPVASARIPIAKTYEGAADRPVWPAGKDLRVATWPIRRFLRFRADRSRGGRRKSKRHRRRAGTLFARDAAAHTRPRFRRTIVEGPPDFNGLRVWGSGGGILGMTHDGSHAEHMVLPQDAVIARPSGLTAKKRRPSPACPSLPRGARWSSWEVLRPVSGPLSPARGAPWVGSGGAGEGAGWPRYCASALAYRLGRRSMLWASMSTSFRRRRRTQSRSGADRRPRRRRRTQRDRCARLRNSRIRWKRRPHGRLFGCAAAARFGSISSSSTVAGSQLFGLDTAAHGARADRASSSQSSVPSLNPARSRRRRSRRDYRCARPAKLTSAWPAGVAGKVVLIPGEAEEQAAASAAEAASRSKPDAEFPAAPA